VGSARILENLVRLSSAGARVTVRVPLIPGINDHAANLEATAAFLTARTVFRSVHVLPYHRIGTGKALRMGHEAPANVLAPPAEEGVRQAGALLERYGLCVTIGG
jgi:pyruvate formate lyase activating enzyme